MQSGSAKITVYLNLLVKLSTSLSSAVGPGETVCLNQESAGGWTETHPEMMKDDDEG